MKNIKRFLTATTLLALFFTFTACADDNATSVATTPHVRVISNGSEHEALEHWNHGFYPVDGPDSPTMSASGWFKVADDVADELTAFLFADDFQIIVEGELLRGEFYYYFYRFTGDEWLQTLAVYHRSSGTEVFLTHGGSWVREQWERISTTDPLSLLNPGEYILDVGGWWGNTESASSYNNFFRFTIPE